MGLIDVTRKNDGYDGSEMPCLCWFLTVVSKRFFSYFGCNRVVSFYRAFKDI